MKYTIKKRFAYVLISVTLGCISLAHAQPHLSNAPSINTITLKDSSHTWVNLERINGSKVDVIETYDANKGTHKIQRIMVLPGAQLTPQDHQILQTVCTKASTNCPR